MATNATGDTAMKHTPGEWEVDQAASLGVPDTKHGDAPAISIYGGGHQLAVVLGNTKGHSLHNAKLIAAAPDGHEILAAIHEFFRHHNPVDPSAMVLNDERTLKQAVADYMAKVTA